MSMDSSTHTGRGSGNVMSGRMDDHEYRSHPYFADSKPTTSHHHREGYGVRDHHHNSHFLNSPNRRQPHNHHHGNRPSYSPRNHRNNHFQSHRPFHQHRTNNNQNNGYRQHHRREEHHQPQRRPYSQPQHQPRYHASSHRSSHNRHENSLRPRHEESQCHSKSCDTDTAPSSRNVSLASQPDHSLKHRASPQDHSLTHITLPKSFESTTMHPKFRGKHSAAWSSSSSTAATMPFPSDTATMLPPSHTDAAEVSTTESSFSQASPLSQESSVASNTGGSHESESAVLPPSTIARTSDDADKFHLPIMKMTYTPDEVVLKKKQQNAELLAKKLAILNRINAANEAKEDNNIVSHVDTQSTAVEETREKELQGEASPRDSMSTTEDQPEEEQERNNTGYPAEKYAQLPPGDIALVQIGARVAVLWNDDDCYYEAKVRKERPGKKKRFLLKYEDGDKEWINFKKVPFYILSGGKEPFSHNDWVNDDDWVTGAVSKSNNPESMHEKDHEAPTDAKFAEVKSSPPQRRQVEDKPRKAPSDVKKSTIETVDSSHKSSPEMKDDAATWEQLYAQFGGVPIPISEKVKLGRRRNRPEAFVAEDSTSAKKKLKSHMEESQSSTDDTKAHTNDVAVASVSEKRRTAERDLLGDARRRKLEKILAREERRASLGKNSQLKKIKLKIPKSSADSGAQATKSKKAISIAREPVKICSATLTKPKTSISVANPLDAAHCAMAQNCRPKSKCGEYAAAEILGQSASPNTLGTNRQSSNNDNRKKDEAKTLTEAEIAQILGEDKPCAGAENWVRRSSRMPNKSALNSPKVKQLLEYLCMNDHPDMVVLKMKKYVPDSATPQIVIDTVLEALADNTNCQSLYIQNYNEGMQDKQMMRLLEILQQPSCNIWCLNIGETYKVKRKTWKKFAKGLRHTKITHMYASEHTITPETKELFRSTIRENRKKHTMHIDPENLDVIVRCTHCWWNPMNAKVLRPYLHAKGYAHILNDKEAQGAKGVTKSEEGI